MGITVPALSLHWMGREGRRQGVILGCALPERLIDPAARWLAKALY